MHSLFRRSLACALVLLAHASAIAAQQTPTSSMGPAPDGAVVRIDRLSGPITMDGRVDEAAWDAIEPLGAVMHQPSSGIPPTERTELRLAYDDDYIYFSCRNYDSEPTRIRAPVLNRDNASLTNDWCVLQLDTFNDEETGLGFGTTPAGLRTDVVWPNDGAAPGNFNWNTFWDAAVHRDDRGWYAEIRIPLSSLRFQDEDGDGVVVMGMSAWRMIGRKNELIIFPAISPRWGGSSFVKASQYRDIAFEGIQPTRPLYVTPYVLGSMGRSWEDGSGSGFDPVTDRAFDIGGDAKFSPASNVTIDVTVNTDFAQVEADNQQVNLTRFSLFFPEQRLFFQERGEIFEYSLGGNERLFHSRRIGIIDGQQVPILAGTRLVGRLGEWDVGFLDMQTGATPAHPSENLGVLRLRRRVLNANSYVGGIVTTRFAEAGAGHNVLYGLDGLFRVFGQDYLTLNWAQSFDDGGPTAADPTTSGTAPHDRALARILWERRGTDGLSYRMELARSGERFEPGLGFLFRTDYTKGAVSAGYGWRPGEASALLRYGASFDGSVFTRNADGSVETVELLATSDVVMKSGHQFAATVTGSYEDLQQEFSLSESAAVPAGQHRFVTGRLAYVPSSGDLIRPSGSIEVGSYYDGRLASASAGATWNASRHLLLTANYELSRLTFPDRDQSFTAHIGRVRTQVMLNTRISGTALIQYSNALDRVSGNIRIRYNPSEGHDLYLVWNERLVADRGGLHPRPPLSEDRTFIVKYARTLTL